MRKTVVSLISLMGVLLFCASADAHDIYVPSDLPLLRRGFDLVYGEQYPEAEKIFQEYINKHPDRPEGYFFMTGRYAEYMNSFHDRSAMPTFEMWAKRTMEKAEAFNSKYPNDPTGHFYLGNLYGFMGLLDAQQQNLVSAFLNAVKAKTSLEKTLELDPAVHDAYFGLGSLFFYGSRKHVEEGGMVGWIVKKFITHDRDMRQEGIAMVQKAVAGGGITADSAFTTLMWLLIIEGRYDEAMPMAVEMSRRWPKDKHGYWAQGRIQLLRGQCADAARNFMRIADIVKQQNLRLDRFPEVEIALELSSLCVESDTASHASREARFKALSARLAANPNIQIEYANSKGVVKDFTAMLANLEKRQYIQPGNGGIK